MSIQMLFSCQTKSKGFASSNDQPISWDTDKCDLCLPKDNLEAKVFTVEFYSRTN